MVDIGRLFGSQRRAHDRRRGRRLRRNSTPASAAPWHDADDERRSNPGQHLRKEPLPRIRCGSKPGLPGEHQAAFPGRLLHRHDNELPEAVIRHRETATAEDRFDRAAAGMRFGAVSVVCVVRIAKIHRITSTARAVRSLSRA